MRLTSQLLHLSAAVTAMCCLSLVSGKAEAQQAPFCVVTPHGQQCWYYDAPSCRRAAEMVRGMCIANQGAQQSAPITSVFDQMQRGAAEGQRMRLEREQAAAQMRLLEAQTQALQQRAPANGITYRCEYGDQGSYYDTQQPQVGCVVISINP